MDTRSDLERARAYLNGAIAQGDTKHVAYYMQVCKILESDNTASFEWACFMASTLEIAKG